MDVTNFLERAVEHHQRGELTQAGAIYEQVLAVEPDDLDALHLLGLVRLDQGHAGEAADLIRRAVAVDPAVAELYESLSRALVALDEVAEAIAALERAVELNPDDAAAHAGLGALLRKSGDFTRAQRHLQRVVELKPDDAAVRDRLGQVLLGAGKTDEAIAAFNSAVKLDPNHADAHRDLGMAFQQAGRHADAVGPLERAIALNPADPVAHFRLGLEYHLQKRLSEAVDQYQRAVAAAPNLAGAWNHLGVGLQDLGDLPGAGDALQRAIALEPAYAEAHFNLAVVHQRQGQRDAARAQLVEAIRLAPNHGRAHNNLAFMLQEEEAFAEALEHYALAITADPADAQPHSNMGSAFWSLGWQDEALAAFRRALALDPGSALMHSNLVQATNYIASMSPQQVFDEHVAFANQRAREAMSRVAPHRNDRQPDRGLRIGFLSADFREHPVGAFMHPILRHLDRGELEAFCYSTTSRPDHVTERLKAQSAQWRDVMNLADEAIAQLIRSDQIDILVDLGGHTAGNRVLVLARKPAPVQVTHFGSPNTTGLRTVDYRMTDALADPPGTTEQWSVEKLWRLPKTAWCYEPLGESPDVAPLPARSAGHVTFANLNNPAKTTPQAMELWSRILRAVPGSKLILKIPQDGQERVRGIFGGYGIERERLRIVTTRDRLPYLKLHNEIDVCLDPFPYNGGVTSCDALWMGVPLVALAGQTYVSRQGVALLEHVGLGELVAQTPQQYFRVATELARDLPRLASLRESLRQKLQRSPIMNYPEFAADLGGAFRQMWRRWCAEKP